jgi:hypothetical protein
MKALAIITAFLCNFSMPEAPHSDVTLLTALKSQSKDSVITNDLRIRPFYLEIISPSSGVQFYRDGILFLSYSKLEEKIPERHLSFGSVRTYTSMVSDTIPANIEQFEIKGTALFPSEATTFSSDFKTMYLSLIPEKSRSEKIFRAQYTSDGWKIDGKPLEICNENYIYSHPCLSADDTFMLFSSDQSGSFGGLDLWITRKSVEGWSNPVNLGRSINSSRNELFATMDSNNNIYFSSDGHPGKGGYDIFVAKYNGSTWDEPQILPDAINTNDDELAYTINKKDSKTAFYTSRSRSGKSRTQLYIIDIGHGDFQKEKNNLGDYFLAMSELKTPTSKDRSSAIVETPESEKGKVLSENPVQPSPVAQVMNEEIPESDKVRGKSVPQTTKEATPQTNPGLATPGSEVKKEKPASIKPVLAIGASEVKGEVIYRIQILANTKPVGSQSISVAGKSYKSFEYLYKGGYRTTIGEFGTLAEAVRLQNTCRQNGYKEAFVVAFKNNVRSTDPALFK